MEQTPVRPGLYGVMAEFEDPTALVEATRRTYDEGYRVFDSYSPFPIHETFAAMHIEDRRVPLLVLGGGIAGMFTGLGLQAWVSAVAYPLNVGGRPYLSWPMFVLNGLPMPYHPVFNVARFAEHASQDRFFLAIEATDPKFHYQTTRAFL